MPRSLPTIPVALALLCAATAGSAQEPYGPLVPRGAVRLGMFPDYSTHSAEYSIRLSGGSIRDTFQGLGDAFTTPSIGISTFPSLTGFEDAVRDASSLPYTMRLGGMASLIEKSSIRVPLTLDVGVFDWLTVGAVVPLVQNETELALDFTADSLGVNAGLSPGLGDGSIVTGFLTDFEASIGAYDEFRGEACSADPTAAPCLDATSVLSDAQAFHAALSQMYGTFMAPVGWSVVGQAMQDRLAAVATAFETAGVAGTPTLLPLSTAPLTLEDLQRLVTDPRFGVVGTYPLQRWRSLWTLGDVELRADARILQLDRPAQRLELTVGGGATLRLGTGTEDDPGNFMDLGTGDGQRDVELRGWMNGAWRERYGLWALLRYGMQGSGITERRASDPGVAMPPRSAQLQFEWDPGDYQLLELSPWIRLADPLTVLGTYRYYRQGDDAFALGNIGDADPALLPDPELLVPGSGISYAQVTVGVVYNRAGSAPTGDDPLEFRILYSQVVDGSGRSVPKARSFQAGFRIFFDVWGS